MIKWLDRRFDGIDASAVLIAAATGTLRNSAQEALPLASCSWVSGTCGHCDFGGAPCGGLPFCYPGHTCTGVHGDGCPSGYTGSGRWWCCCFGQLVSCSDCKKSGQPTCICQGSYEIPC